MKPRTVHFSKLKVFLTLNQQEMSCVIPCEVQYSGFSYLKTAAPELLFMAILGRRKSRLNPG
jgi:hypothetical protein